MVIILEKAKQITMEHMNCVGLRNYYGKHENGSPTLVFVGVDKNRVDLVGEESNQYIERCSPYCSPANVLDSTCLTAK
jgi:hypothetical protein